MQKVIIIGAGPAGLTAADKLLDEKEKYDVTILEETSEIGGISRTVKYNGNRMDIGGHRFFSKDPEVMKYWEELMPIQGENSFDDEELKRKKQLNLGGPNPNTEDEVMLIRTRVSRIYFLKKFFDYPVSLKWKTLKNMGLLRTIKVGFSYLKAVILKRKENSLEDFYINRFGEELYKMFFKNYTERLWGRKASEISADWGAQRVKGVSINAIIKDMFNKLFKRSLIGDSRFPVGIYFEDLPFIISNIIKAKKIVYLNEVLYRYRFNPKSIMGMNLFGSTKVLDILSSCEKLDEYTKGLKFDKEKYESLKLMNTIYIFNDIMLWKNLNLKGKKELLSYLFRVLELTYGDIYNNIAFKEVMKRDSFFRRRMKFMKRFILKRKYMNSNSKEELINKAREIIKTI